MASSRPARAAAMSGVPSPRRTAFALAPASSRRRILSRSPALGRLEQGHVEGVFVVVIVVVVHRPFLVGGHGALVAGSDRGRREDDAQRRDGEDAGEAARRARASAVARDRGARRSRSSRIASTRWPRVLRVAMDRAGTAPRPRSRRASVTSCSAYGSAWPWLRITASSQARSASRRSRRHSAQANGCGQ